MPTHTPGPWLVCEHDPTLIAWGGAKLVATVNADYSQRRACLQADANLIAAAPDMLAALREVLPILESYKASVESKGEAYEDKASRALYAIEHARDAIAKAGGH